MNGANGCPPCPPTVVKEPDPISVAGVKDSPVVPPTTKSAVSSGGLLVIASADPLAVNREPDPT